MHVRVSRFRVGMSPRQSSLILSLLLCNAPSGRWRWCARVAEWCDIAEVCRGCGQSWLYKTVMNSLRVIGLSCASRWHVVCITNALTTIKYTNPKNKLLQS